MNNKLIHLFYSLVPVNTDLLMSFVITIPKNAYIEHMYIVNKKDFTVESDLTNSAYDMVEAMVTTIPQYSDAEEWFNDAFEKVYEDDECSTYLWNTEFEWVDNNSNAHSGIVVNDLTFVTLKLDVLTEASNNADCQESSLTIPVYNRTKILCDIVRVGRLLNGDCTNCDNIPEGLIKKIMEFRVFEASAESREWLMLKKMYDDLYDTTNQSATVSYTLTNKCNCHG